MFKFFPLYPLILSCQVCLFLCFCLVFLFYQPFNLVSCCFPAHLDLIFPTSSHSQVFLSTQLSDLFLVEVLHIYTSYIPSKHKTQPKDLYLSKREVKSQDPETWVNKFPWKGWNKKGTCQRGSAEVRRRGIHTRPATALHHAGKGFSEETQEENSEIESWALEGGIARRTWVPQFGLSGTNRDWGKNISTSQLLHIWLLPAESWAIGKRDEAKINQLLGLRWTCPRKTTRQVPLALWSFPASAESST